MYAYLREYDYFLTKTRIHAQTRVSGQTVVCSSANGSKLVVLIIFYTEKHHES